MGNGNDTKPKGWFSRRHENDDAHRAAVNNYNNKPIGPTQTWNPTTKQWEK